MNTTRIALVSAALVLLASPAHTATVLATSPAQASSPMAQTMRCAAVNAGTKPVELTVEALDYGGNVVSSTDGTYPAGHGDELTSGAGGVWCRFTVTKGAARGLRAAALYDNGVSYTLSVPAH